MPRKPRLQSSTDYYHVMMRGNNKEKIFYKAFQKNYFLDCLREQSEEGLIEIASYCIMDNHVHIIIKSDLTNLSTAIKIISTKYALMFNIQNDRVGHVFQGRYKSEAINNEKYFLNVIRYVHNNPVKAKVINSPEMYKWSSYNEFIKKPNIINSNQRDIILQLFGNITNFIKFHNIEDLNEYLDTKEEVEENRLELAQRIISAYFKDNGINDTIEIKHHPSHLENIIGNLISQTKLSNRQIAKLLNTTYYFVSSIRNQSLGTVPFD